MKQAVRAFSVGDKLYQMERIHNKIVSYTSSYYGFSENIEIDELIEFLEKLKFLVDCMTENLNNQNKYIQDYHTAISQTLSRAKKVTKMNNERLFRSCCYLHGTFIIFRRELKKNIKRGCELKYQEVCSPLLLLELKIKEANID